MEQRIIKQSELAWEILKHEVEMMQKDGVLINTENWLSKRDSAISEAHYIFEETAERVKNSLK